MAGLPPNRSGEAALRSSFNRPSVAAERGLLGGALTSGCMFLLLRRRSARTAATASAAPLANATDAAAARASWRAMRWLAGMNVALAIVRESLSFWSPLLLVEVAAMSAEQAVQRSALLPLFGGVGVLLAGPFADRGRSEERRVGKEGRYRWSPFH